ncbi:hypothetical protein HY636_05855 [Candidatus Woesearchaeota archaeon]|nr:hypothetical protein [Candidatus Woesearchaeota archaeon]
MIANEKNVEKKIKHKEEDYNNNYEEADYKRKSATKDSMNFADDKNSHPHFKTEDDAENERNKFITAPIVILLIIVALLTIYNQYQIGAISDMASSGFKSKSSSFFSGGDKDLSKIKFNEISSTGQSVAAVFALEDAKTTDDVMAIMLPTGTPDYGTDLGVSFDDPVGSLSKLSKMYKGLKAEVEKNNPEGWKRFMGIASMPLGISCEYCCGLKTVGVDKNGNSMCGCQHNPAILAVTLYLSAYTDYNDGEILREAMKWKTLFFPKDMIELGMKVAGGDASSLKDLPGMVGGC